LQAAFTQHEVHLGYFNNVEINNDPQLTTSTKTSPTMKTYNKFNRTQAVQQSIQKYTTNRSTSSPRKKKQSKYIGVLQFEKKPQSTSQNTSRQIVDLEEEDSDSIRPKSEYLTNTKTSQPEQTNSQQVEKVNTSYRD